MHKNVRYNCRVLFHNQYEAEQRAEAVMVWLKILSSCTTPQLLTSNRDLPFDLASVLQQDSFYPAKTVSCWRWQLP